MGQERRKVKEAKTPVTNTVREPIYSNIKHTDLPKANLTTLRCNNKPRMRMHQYTAGISSDAEGKKNDTAARVGEIMFLRRCISHNVNKLKCQ